MHDIYVWFDLISKGQTVSKASTDPIMPSRKVQTMHSFMDAKLMAKLLRQGLADRGVSLTHSDCLELVARQFGVSSWNILSARIDAAAAEAAPLLMPQGWRDTSSSHDGYYRMGLDPARKGCAVIQSTPLADHQSQSQFGSMAQIIAAEPYRGRAVRVSCELSGRDVDGGATLWLRIDDAEGRRLRFENLMDRPGVAVRGTEDWKGFAITLDVPEAADSVYFGFLLSGRGTAWARNFAVAEVDVSEAPARQRRYRFDQPTNLDFGA